MTDVPTTTRPIHLPDDNYGFNPEKSPHLIAKFRAMDPEQRASILGIEQEQV